MKDSNGKIFFSELFLRKIFIFLALALTIPAVTVDVKLNGLPTANTQSPNLTSSEFPNCANERFISLIFKSAKSVFGSAPMISAFNSLPSFNITRSFEDPSTT